MSIDVMKQALEALGIGDPWHPTTIAAIKALNAAIEQAQEPIAWIYPEGLEALKSGKPWVAYGTDGDRRIPLFLYNDAVAPRVEPRASESGAGFESLPASPYKPTEQNI